VFAPGDGLGNYRRLIAAAAIALGVEGALLIQLHRRVVAVSAPELHVFAAAA
jgi:hypothetical protein